VSEEGNLAVMVASFTGQAQAIKTGHVLVARAALQIAVRKERKEEQRDLPVREERGHGRILICEDHTALRSAEQKVRSEDHTSRQ
jgi:hypothetical protein